MTSRFLFVYQTLAAGGVEAVIRDRMEILLVDGHEVFALFLKDRGGLSLFQPFMDHVRLFDDTESAIQYISELHADWIFHFDTPDLVSGIAKSSPRSRQVYEVHTTLPHSLKRLSRTGIKKQIEAIVVPSLAQRNLVQSTIGTDLPFLIVPNGLPDTFYQKNSMASKPGSPIVLWIGRLEAHKNWRTYLKISAMIAGKPVDAQFWLIGGRHAIPEQHLMLWSQLKVLNLVSNFRWFPEIPRAKLPGVMQMAAQSGGCLVSTSQAESFGMVVLEAMASGCPVVVPELDALLELVHHGQEGFVYPRGDWRSAADYVTKLLTDPVLQLQMGGAAQKRSLLFTARASVDCLLGQIAELERGQSAE